MSIRRIIHNAKNFFHKKLKSLLFKEYSKLPKTNAFPISNTSTKEMQHLDNDDLYTDISEQWQPDHNESMVTEKNDAILGNSAMREGNSGKCVMKTKQERRLIGKERGHILAEKMRELEMMDDDKEYDRDHVLDVEEVLHHYSRLTCPVYQDIVDKFLMDMYSEFLLPHPSVSLNNSMRRRLNSMRF